MSSLLRADSDMTVVSLNEGYQQDGQMVSAGEQNQSHGQKGADKGGLLDILAWEIATSRSKVCFFSSRGGCVLLNMRDGRSF